MKYKENSTTHKLLHTLKKVWVLNFARRVYKAAKAPNRKYAQILQWGIHSREDTNYTYHITPLNKGYLADFISLITGAKREKVLQYMTEAEQDTELHQTILKAIDASRFKHVADAEVRFGRRLGWYAFARIIKPKVIVETGVDKGLGAILLCAALLKNKQESFPGRYFGTDINPQAGYMLTGKYAETGEILYGDSIESLSKMSDPIELFINDSDHSIEYEYREYQTIRPLINNKTIILGDNAHYSDKLEAFSLENNRDFLFFKEEPYKHWHEGSGIGFSFTRSNWNAL